MESYDLRDQLQSSIHDYYLLLNKGYPSKASLKLVGDRYRLSADQRKILYRGVNTEIQSESNSKKRIASLPANSTLHIDGYNILFTLLNYLKGRMLFISSDGFLRDIGGVHGRIQSTSLFNQAMEIFADFISRLVLDTAEVFFDRPVSHSQDHSNRLKKMLGPENLHIQCSLAKSADGALLSQKTGVLASSDSIIISRTKLPVFDLSMYILKKKFRFEPSLDISSIVH